jgi:epoxyqueuosine reductase
VDQLTLDLRERAIEEGFDLVGIAAAGPAETYANLRSWIAAGMHGDMRYMSRDSSLREDPRRLLAGCRSVVSVAMSYHTDQPLSQAPFPADDPRAWVSRYAWGRDYHKLMKKALVRVGRWLEQRRPGTVWRACVDTAPILEREWAARSGLGWIGKNTALLNRDLGSELFLGLLLTDAELCSDGPTTDHCGRCTACLDACPTNALVEPRRLDARLCVAYLTVEHRRAIRDPLRAGIGTMVAGCDICQEVCPWTARAPADLHVEFKPDPARFRPRLKDLEALDEEGYRQWRTGSPLNRIPYWQFRRTLEIVRHNFERILESNAD